jgi:hypothetical protein
VFLELNRILGVGVSAVAGSSMGGLPAQFGAQFLVLLPTAESVASVALGLMSLCMEQPDNEAFSGFFSMSLSNVSTNASLFFVLLQCTEDREKDARYYLFCYLCCIINFLYSLETAADDIEQYVICIPALFYAASLSLSFAIVAIDCES